MTEPTHREILDRVIKVEVRQDEHAKIANEVRDDVKDIKKAQTKMIGFFAGAAAAVSVFWVAGLAIVKWVKGV